MLFVVNRWQKVLLKNPPFANAARAITVIGALFAFVALLGGVTGNSAVFLIATSFALGAAFLNAAFGFCLGCQIYLILLRLFKRS